MTHETTGITVAAPGHLLVVGRLFDYAKMGAYSKALADVYAQHGGAYLAIGGPGRGVDWLAGPQRDRSLVLARFASVAATQGFWWSPEYRAAARLREGAGAFTVVALAGRAAPSPPTPGGVYLVVLTITLDAAAADAWRAHFAAAVAAAGGHVVAAATGAELRPLEGDPQWDRVDVAHLPTPAAASALPAEPHAAALLARAGVAYVASAPAFTSTR